MNERPLISALVCAALASTPVVRHATIFLEVTGA